MTGRSSRVPVAQTRSDLASALDRLRKGGRSVALVPTMGALHEGHLTLVDRARSLADTIVMSIFVNPLQFGAGEDFARYPRDLEGDVALARGRGVDLVFAPEEGEMYRGARPAVTVRPGPMGNRLCGAFRPGHFEGVLTVVAKLFGIVRPEVAVFGRKDLQQCALVRRMAGDLDLGVLVEVAPLVREADGLAMSSRNRYLSAPERRTALGLHRALDAADRAFRGGETDAFRLLDLVRETVAAGKGLDLQYAELVESDDLEPLQKGRAGAVVAVAGFVGTTRLIDNLVLGSEPDPRVVRPAPDSGVGASATGKGRG